MADKVLQDPTKQRLFEHSSMHELFEFPSSKANKENEKIELLLKRYASLNATENQVKEELKKGGDDQQLFDSS
jgi:hypothetical protein